MVKPLRRIAGAIGVAGCLWATAPFSQAATLSLVAIEPVREDAIAQNSAVEALPATKTLSVVVEGEPQDVTLQLYSNPELPLVTYYPATMTVEEVCDVDGCGVSFINEAMGTAVLFVFPTDARLASQVEPQISGAAGLLQDNDWAISGEYTDARYLRFPWAKKLISFQAPDLDALGMAYVGELNDQGFAAIVVFPPDAGDGFVPLANAMLSEVQLR